MGVGGMSDWGLSWDVLRVAAGESRLVLGYPLYTVITIVVTIVHSL